MRRPETVGIEGMMPGAAVPAALLCPGYSLQGVMRVMFFMTAC
jgi:hypothetical protein